MVQQEFMIFQVTVGQKEETILRVVEGMNAELVLV